MDATTSLLNGESDWDTKAKTLNRFYTNPNFNNMKKKTQNEVVNSSTTCKSYLAIGSPLEYGTVSSAAIFKGFWDVSKADSLVFFKQDRKGLATEQGDQVYADRLITDPMGVSPEKSGDKYFILCQQQVDFGDTRYGEVKTFNLDGNSGARIGIYVSGDGVMHGSAWNDYAEKRRVSGAVEPGDVVCENGDGTLSLSKERLQICPYVVTDTYGFVIGQEGFTPLALAGRALVKVEDENVSVGDCVCAGVGGKAYVMSREEIKEFPDRILGTVIEIPDYDEWLNNIKINGRVWIRIR